MGRLLRAERGRRSFLERSPSKACRSFLNGHWLHKSTEVTLIAASGLLDCSVSLIIA